MDECDEVADGDWMEASKSQSDVNGGVGGSALGLLTVGWPYACGRGLWLFPTWCCISVSATVTVSLGAADDGISGETYLVARGSG